MNFTTDQKKIIDARHCSVLVSAAAGSGKTAVMVERIIGLICDEHEDTDRRVDIDRMLIVTFTRAAASQMREKIATAIEKKLAENPTDAHLQRQSALVANAQITTIDSFCLYILRNNFADVDLDPGFRIADEGEIKLLKADVLSELMEERYEQGNEDFLNMAEFISTGVDDSSIEELVLKLYEAAMSNPWPLFWLEERKRDYETEGDCLGGKWYKSLTGNICEQLEAVKASAENTNRLVLMPAGPYMYGDQIESDIAYVDRCKSDIKENPDAEYETLRAYLEGITFVRLSTKKDDSVDETLRKRARDMRDAYKKKVSGIISSYFFQAEKTHVSQMKACDLVLKTLIDLTIDFKAKLDAGMREKGMLSFADCEHLALDVMVRRTDDGFEYTQTAEEYRGFFDYVMIDEYQDSNYIQELLLSAVSGEMDGNYNRFMVGDVKQSIYRFRKAQPQIFMDKYADYEKACENSENGNKLLVDLHQNFRSRSQVLNVVNSICSGLMSKSVGDVEYDDRAALHLGAEYLEDTTGDSKAELIIFDKENEEGLDAKEVEARGIALRIEQLMSSGIMVRDGDNATDIRKLRYGDIVILLRKTTGYTETFSRIIGERGIPVHVSGISGYFTTYEIKTLLQLLKIIVNPLQDISFYGVITSVIGDFSPSEVANIKQIYAETVEKLPEPYLYEACKYVSSIEGHSELSKKISGFLEMLERYRVHSEYMGVEELLGEILRDTDYRTKMYAMKDGTKRLANIDMLMKKASDYAKTSYFGLYNFLRYVDMVQKYEISIPESETIDENADVVRIMTIHKSKGLEFPVCFVSGLGGQFNEKDYTASLLVDSDMGVGMCHIDTKRRVQAQNLRREIIAEEIKKETYSEELRVLYVALTRAKEKLILTGTSADLKKKIIALRDSVLDGNIRPSTIRSEKSFLAWLLLVAASSGYGEAIAACLDSGENKLEMSDLHMSFRFFPEDELSVENTEQLVSRQILKQHLLTLVPDNDGHEPVSIKETDVIKYIEALYDADYSHHELDGLITKASVSDLKHRAIEEQQEGTVDICPDKPAADFEETNPQEKRGFDSELFREPVFISHKDNKSGATERGSAFHRVMELVNIDEFLSEPGESGNDLSHISKRLRKQIDGFVADGKLPASQGDILRGRTLDVLAGIFTQDVCARMAKADRSGNIFKEAPFMLGIPASQYNPIFPEKETILVQGIIDVYWKEDDGFVILDYKTDRVDNESELVERYKTQLDWYEKALEAMHMHVKEKLIYSFALEKTISL